MVVDNKEHGGEGQSEHGLQGHPNLAAILDRFLFNSLKTSSEGREGKDDKMEAEKGKEY